MQLLRNADVRLLVNIFVLVDVFQSEVDLFQSKTVALQMLLQGAALLEALTVSSSVVKGQVHKMDHAAKTYN